MTATAERMDTSGGQPKRVVTFASSHTSILIPTECQVSPLKPRERARALRARRATPRKRTAGDGDASPSPAMNRLRGKKPRLVESGAVRVEIDRRRNPRRGNARALVNHREQRLIDRGAVRLLVTRHTTPRRLYATRNRIYSPPPPSSSKRRKVPQSEIVCRKPPAHWGASARAAATPTPSKKRVPQSERIHRKPPMAGGSTLVTAATPTPLKCKRSNAYIGGHRFRSTFSPYYSTPSTPAITEVLYEEGGDEDDLCLELERGLSRTLFD